MPDAAAYLETLAERLRTKPEQLTRLKFRTLLGRFGHGRRDAQTVAFIRGALQARGLAADFSSTRPRRLDDRIVVRVVASPHRATSAGAGTLVTASRLSQRSPTRGQSRSVRRDGPPTPLQTAATPYVPANQAPDLSSIAERAIAATVEIWCGEGIGAGVIVHPKGLVLTARHVVDEGGYCARSVRVTLADGRKARGLVFRAHAILDVALLWLDRAGPFAWVALGDPQALRPAEGVLAIGHPEGFRNTVTRGSICNPRAEFNGVEFIQTDAAADQGNSGGSVLNLAGEVVGINSWQYGTLDSGKFAVPIDYVGPDITDAIALGRRRCLAARFCRACGHLEVIGRRRFCRVCGSRTLAWGR